MSLTSELRSPTSPVSRWFAAHLAPAAVEDCIRYVNDVVGQRRALRPPHTDPPLAGMAFDYVFRWLLGPLEATAAHQGALICEMEGWIGAHSIVDALIVAGDTQPDLGLRSRLAICLSWFEMMFRSGQLPQALASFFGQEMRASVIAELQAAAPVATVKDIAQLATTIPSVWGDDLTLPFVLNPTFAGSELVGGADADWIAGHTLYDCKCSGKRRPFAASHLHQILGYVLLDSTNQYEIQRVGWYFARQQMRVTLPLLALLERLCGTRDLVALRAGFVAALSFAAT